MDQSLSSTAHSTTTSTVHSSRRLADIAARVITELNLNHHHPFHDDDDFYHQNDDHLDDDVTDDDTDDSEFEFAILTGADNNTSPISADEIFSNGQIKPTLSFPLFSQTHPTVTSATPQPQPQPTVRVPLRRLMMSDKTSGGVASTSSSEGDELEGVPDGTYCVWVPNKNKDKNDDVSMKKKSKSTGTGDSHNTSKRWRIRDLLLNRSHSDGKDTFVFLTPHHHNGDIKKRREKGNLNANTNTKKSYLPYRQDLVGFFSVRPLKETHKTM